MEDAYIYLILCAANNKLYVGSSINYKRRWKDHRTCLKGKRHSNVHLQRAWDKYGSKAFEFYILESCEESERYDREQYWINTLRSSDSDIGLNIQSVVAPIYFSKVRSKTRRKEGVPHSKGTKIKLSQLQKHKHLSKSTVLAIYTMYVEGCKINHIVRLLKIKQSLVWKIVNRKALYANIIIDDFLTTEVYN